MVAPLAFADVYNKRLTFKDTKEANLASLIQIINQDTALQKKNYLIIEILEPPL